MYVCTCRSVAYVCYTAVILMHLGPSTLCNPDLTSICKFALVENNLYEYAGTKTIFLYIFKSPLMNNCASVGVE